MPAVNTRALEDTLSFIRAQLQRAFHPDTAAQGFPGTTPSTGHCAAVSAIVHELVGGKLISTTIGGHSHWLNRLTFSSEEFDVDLTGDQFGLPAIQIADADALYPQTRVRDGAELNVETLERTRVLAERAGFLNVAQVISSLLKHRKELSHKNA